MSSSLNLRMLSFKYVYSFLSLPPLSAHPMKGTPCLTNHLAGAKVGKPTSRTANLDPAFSVLVGACGGLLYLRLLSRSVTRLGGDRRSMGEAIGGADYERVEGVLGVEAGIFTAGRYAVAAAAASAWYASTVTWSSTG